MPFPRTRGTRVSLQATGAVAGPLFHPSTSPCHFPALLDHVDLPPATLITFISNCKVPACHRCLDSRCLLTSPYLSDTSKGLKHLPVHSQPSGQTTVSPSALNKPCILFLKWPLHTACYRLSSHPASVVCTQTNGLSLMLPPPVARTVFVILPFYM